MKIGSSDHPIGEIGSKVSRPDVESKSSPHVIHTQPELHGPSVDEPDHVAVMHELELIRASPFFHSSKRSLQFLNYVVQYRLDGNSEPLKERMIGAVLFNRPADYSTGDDSVVRVQAGEVRRRLEQYYQAPPADSLVRIELPLRSYSPELRWASNALPIPLQASPQEAAPAPAAAPTQVSPFVLPARSSKPIWIAGLFIGLVLAAVVAVVLVHRVRVQESQLNEFWSPIFATSKPLLICLPKPIFYRPSMGLYKRHEKTPGESDNEVDRMNSRPNLQPDEKLQWSDMVEYPDFGVGKGDVKAAFRLANLLAKLGKDNEVRIGNDYSFDDLRNSPAIVIGAFSNRWTMSMTSGLHFAFAEHDGVFRIQEQGPSGRSWFAEVNPRSSEVVADYGLVTRLVNSSTGQFVVDVAGITSPGSEAAAEVASSQQDLEKALYNAPSDWKQKNLQIVVKTTVTDSVAGPAQIVAVHVW